MSEVFTAIPVGIRLYTKNVANGLDTSGHANDVFNQIADINPDALVLTEASSTHADLFHINFAAWLLQSAGYEVVVGQSSESDRDDGHYILGAAKIELGPKLKMVELAAGRNAVHIAMLDRKTLKRIDFLGSHFNDVAARRGTEVAAVPVLAEKIASEQGNLVGIMGDKNSSKARGFVPLVSRAAAWALGPFVRREWIHEARPGDQNPSTLNRLVSIIMRAGAQSSGLEVSALEQQGYEDADAQHHPTTFVPSLPDELQRLMRKIPAVGTWLLDRPHLQNDHIMANQGRLEDFRLYGQQDGDNHLGISAVYYHDSAQ